MVNTLLRVSAIGGLLALAPAVRAQVGIGTTSPDPSAVLDLKSSTGGLLAPRMTASQLAAIPNPADGLLVYQTDGLQPGLRYFRAGTGWTFLNPTGADNLGNHSAAQALMMNGLPINFGTALTQQLNLWNTEYSIGIQPHTLMFRTGGGFAWYKGGSYTATQNDPGAGGAAQMLLTDNGNLGLGIGAAAVEARLHVGGTLRLDGGVIQRGGAPITNTADLGLYSRLSGTWMRFVTNGAPIRFYSDDNIGTNPNLTIESNGNVGIGLGLDGAANRLDVRNTGRSGTHASGRALYVSGDFAEAGNGVEFRHSNGTQGIGFGYNSLYAAGTNPNQHLNLMPKGTGNVGIGTTTPTARLDVASGSVRLPGAGGGDTWFNFSGNDQNYLRGTTIIADLGGNVGIGVSNPGQKLEVNGRIKISGSGNGITFPDNTVQNTAATTPTGADFIVNGTAQQASANFNVSGAGTVGGVLTAGGGARINGGNTLEFGAGVSGKEVNAGKIGYQTFSGALDIVGAGTTGTNRRIAFYNEGGASFSGNVGIGVNSPTQRLEVAGQIYSSTGGFRFPDNTVQTTAAAAQTLSVSGQNLAISGGNTVTLPVGADNLGNHTATQNLNLAANQLVGNGGTSGLAIGNTGNVGIGTSAPAQKLDVRGNMGNAANIGSSPHDAGSQGTWRMGRFNASEFAGIETEVMGGAGCGNAAALKFFTWGCNIAGAREVMRLDQFGRLGIGTANPSFPLDVQSTVSSNNASYVYYSANGQNGHMGYAQSGGSMSIRAAGRVVAPEFNATSDRRLKTVIGLSDRAADLALLSKIRITDYTMRDRVEYGDRQFKKVIAQEVEEVFPQAVNRQIGFLPDVYALATSATAEGDSLLRLTLPKALVATAGQRLKLIGPAGEVVGTVKASRGATLTVRGAQQLVGQQVFVFGLEYADVRTVDYEALAMLNVSATQELARQVAELQKQNDELRQQAQAQGTRLDQQQSALQALQAREASQTADIAQRLRALESLLGTQASAK